MAHQSPRAPLLSFFVSFFCKTTNGAPPAGAPLVTRVTNGAFVGGAPLVTWDQLDILDSHTYPLTFPTSFSPPPPPSLSRLPPPPHLICTINSSKLSG